MWHSLSKNLELLETRHASMNERIASNSACASLGMLLCPENDNFEKQYFLEKKFARRFSPDADGASRRPPRLDPGRRFWFACFFYGQGRTIVCAGLLWQGFVQDLHAFRGVPQDSCEGNTLRKLLWFIWGSQKMICVIFSWILCQIFVFQKFLHECDVATATAFCAVLVSLRASLYSASSAFFLAARFLCRSRSSSNSLFLLSFETEGCFTWVWDWLNLRDTGKIQSLHKSKEKRIRHATGLWAPAVPKPGPAFPPCFRVLLLAARFSGRLNFSFMAYVLSILWRTFAPGISGGLQPLLLWPPWPASQCFSY